MRHEARQAFAGRLGGFELVLEHELDDAENLCGHLPQQGVLALEMVEERRRHDVRRFGDLAHRGALEPLGAEEVHGHVVDAQPPLALSLLQPSHRRRLRHGIRLHQSILMHRATQFERSSARAAPLRSGRKQIHLSEISTRFIDLIKILDYHTKLDYTPYWCDIIQILRPAETGNRSPGSRHAHPRGRVRSHAASFRSGRRGLHRLRAVLGTGSREP